MNAVYKLDEYPASFNFFEFLVAATTLGADHIIFDDSRGIKKKYPDHLTQQRIENILKPGCALAGASYSVGKGEGIDPGYNFNVVLDAYRKTGSIKRLKSVLPPKKERFVITLRNYYRREGRNSNREAWLRFARDIGAFVIEDFFDKPIDLHERMAYYAGAQMNYFVANGPSILAFCSDYPYIAIMSGANEEYHRSIGFSRNQPIPFAHKNQKVFWQEDSYENIIAAHASCNFVLP